MPSDADNPDSNILPYAVPDRSTKRRGARLHVRIVAAIAAIIFGSLAAYTIALDQRSFADYEAALLVCFLGMVFLACVAGGLIGKH
jgi:peptidoglycan/LPS O-acetylase OafA/YrhL